ncbi:hypothetical protein NTE_01174 [Candidatus Nitrososphaera evergladensis SR1]|uniref:Uncharacterized protein n=1 Tax=Candidatus Nitrososphaera evergladensis SR1 TaxID=1459636 RepID=A0A075MR08_9ARCH|nr:hypothetical protein [Candidatus Nitrososphaera evergladensis]AIF83247.1 hypothetical protein NTE_01174 [Candidatus Nitrososphaera evergladensis SR1]
MSTLAERYAAFQQANLAAQQQAIQTGQQQQITSSRDASGNVSFGYSPTGAPASPPTGSTPSPIGRIDRGAGGGGSGGSRASKTIIDVGNELQVRQEQEQAARQAAAGAAQNRSQGSKPGMVDYYRQQIEQSQVAAEQRRMAQQTTITVQHPPEYIGPYSRTSPGPMGFDPFKNARFEYDESGKVKNVTIGAQSDIGFDAKGIVKLEEKDGQQYAVYQPTEAETKRFYGYSESLTLPVGAMQTLLYGGFQAANRAAQEQALATGKPVTLTADKINEQALAMVKPGGKYESGIPIQQDQGDYQRWAYDVVKSGRNPPNELKTFGTLTVQEAREKFAGHNARNFQRYYIDPATGQPVDPFHSYAQQQAANERWANQVQNADWSAAYTAQRAGMRPTNPFALEMRNAAGFYGSMQIVGQYRPHSAEGKEPLVKDAPAPTPGFFGPVIDAAKGTKVEAENLVANLAYGAQGVAALLAPRQIPRRTLDLEGNEISRNIPKPPELKSGVGTDLSSLAIQSAYQLATTGKTDVKAADLQKIGENIIKNIPYAAGNLALEALSFIGPGLVTKGARVAQVGTTVSKAEEIAAMAAKRVGYQETTVQALGKAETPLTRGPFGTFWRPLWESGRVIYPKMEITGEAATLAAGKVQLKVPTMPEAFAIRAGADVTAPTIGRILPRAGEVRIATAPLSEEQKIALRGFEQPKVGQGPPAPRTLQPGELAAKDIKDYYGRGFTGAVAGKILGTDARVATEAADISLQKAAVSITGKTPKLGEFGLDLAEQLPQRTVRASPLIPVSSDVPLWSRVTFDLKEVKAAASALAKRASQVRGAEEALKDLPGTSANKTMRPFDFTPAAEVTKIGKTSLTPLERADAFTFDASLQEEASKAAEKSLSNALGASAAAALAASSAAGGFGYAAAAAETGPQQQETITDLAQVVAFPAPSSSGRGPPSMGEIFTNRVQMNLAKFVDNKPGQAVEQARKASENMINALAKMQNSKGTEKQIATQQLLGNLKLEGESDLDRALRKNIRETAIEKRGLQQLQTPVENSQRFLKQITNFGESRDTGSLIRSQQTQIPVQTPAELFKLQQQLATRFDFHGLPRVPPERRPPDFPPFFLPETTGKYARASRREQSNYFERLFAVPDPLVAVFGTKQAKRLPGYRMDDYGDYLREFLPGSKKSRSRRRR